MAKKTKKQKHTQKRKEMRRRQTARQQSLPKIISNGIRPTSAAMFLESLPLVFQPGQSKGLNAVYHFTFIGDESLEGTVTIREKSLTVREGLEGKCDLHVTVDSQTWIKFLAKEINLIKALITRKIKIKGPPKLMKAFAKCFPS
jgi:alkyl sulfatase BDS1-like metallo-beta-lactamase superfamily hydrolase